MAMVTQSSKKSLGVGSIPTIPTMNNITTFIYKGTTIETPNLEKKLKRMKLTLNDIQIIPNRVKQIEPESIPDTSIKLYRFNNIKDGRYIIGVYDNLNHLIWNPETKTGIKDFNINDWQRVI